MSQPGFQPLSGTELFGLRKLYYTSLFHPQKLTSLELQYVSPKLLMCRDLELAVPGTYDPNQPIIRIQSIAPSLQVITSKQRPRKLTIMGKNLAGNMSGLENPGYTLIEKYTTWTSKSSKAVTYELISVFKVPLFIVKDPK